MSQVEENIKEEFAPHSCSSCNKSHRRCDRKMPSCTTCVKKGRTCEYDRSIRSYNKNARYEPYPQYETELILDVSPPAALSQPTINNPISLQTLQQPSISQHQISLVSSSVPSSLVVPTFSSIESVLKVLTDGGNISAIVGLEAELDRYFDNMFVSTPFLESSRASQAILHRQVASRGTLPTEAQEREDLAACLGMQALFYKRIQQHVQAKKTLQATISLLDNLFDRVLTSFSLATAYMFLTFCLVDECEFDRASFYHMCVDAFLQRCKKSPKSQDELYIIRERYLRCMFLLVHHHRADCTDLTRLVKIMISCHFLNKKYRRRSHQIQVAPTLMMGTVQDEEIDKFLPFVDVILDDLDNNRNGFPITPAVVDLMTNKMRDSLNESKDHGIMDLYFKRIGFYLVAQGAKLQCLLAEGPHMDLEARRVADHIADICSYGTFVYCWSTVQHAVAVAIKTLTRFLHTTVNPDDQTQLVCRLRMLVTSLRALADKYKIVAFRHSVLIENTERIIKGHEDHTKLLSLYASLTHPEPTFNSAMLTRTEERHKDEILPEKSVTTENISNGVRLCVDDIDLELFFGDFFQDKNASEKVNRGPTPQQDLFL